MAELTDTQAALSTPSACCAPEAQADCCQPSDKADCCEPESSSCGCSAGGVDGEDMGEATRADMAEWTGCIAGALTRREFEQALFAAGLRDVKITETHRVHDKAASAIIRARKPILTAEAAR